MKQELAKVDPKEFGLEVEQVSTIEQAFLPKIQEREALIEIYEQLITSELTPELCRQAKEVRLKLVKVRTGISDIHKTQKAFFLSAGRFVDAWKNKETLPVEQMEEKLSEIENYYVNIERAKKAQLQAERLLEVSKYTEHPANALGDMETQVYEAYLQGLKVAHNVKIEAEAKAEAERLAAIETERLEQIRIKEENARLQKEAEEKRIRDDKRNAELRPFIVFIRDYPKMLNMTEDDYKKEFSEIKKGAELQWEFERKEQIRKQAEAEQKEKDLAAERAKAESERKAIEAKAQKEREESEQLLLAERKAYEEKLRSEMEAARKVAAELEAKKQAEAEAVAKRTAEILAEEKAKALAAKAPFKQKANKWVDSFVLPEFSELNTTTDDIKLKFESFKKWAKIEIEKL